MRAHVELFLLGLRLLASACLLLASLAAHASVGWNANDSSYVDSADLPMTVIPLSGSMSVYDRNNGLTWDPRASATHTAFSMESSWELWGEDLFPNCYGDPSDTTNYDRYVAWGLNPACVCRLGS